MLLYFLSRGVSPIFATVLLLTRLFNYYLSFVASHSCTFGNSIEQFNTETRSSGAAQRTSV
ncbi:MAG: hypothetical protein E6H08_10205 [Bacteroidetes bacterium]|nr:MAG: hypothetical protein E6H08_10205 [Bacteroidota bacterium]